MNVQASNLEILTSGEVIDCLDNCPAIANMDQYDSDGDGKGDACEEVGCDDGSTPPCDEEPGCPDEDWDDVCDSDDNCPIDFNRYQDDHDGDGEGSSFLGIGTADGMLAQEWLLGTGLNFDEDASDYPAAVVAVTKTVSLPDDVNQASLSLMANDNNKVAQAFVEIRAPNVELLPENGSEQLDADDFIRVVLDAPASDGPWTKTVDVFTTPGKYEVFYFVERLSNRIGHLVPQRNILWLDAQHVNFRLCLAL